MPEFVQEHAGKENEDEDDAGEGGDGSGMPIGGEAIEGEEDEEGRVDPDFNAGDGGDAE